MIPANVCPVCRNYQGKGKCKAYPRGIPEAISTGKNDHEHHYPGDGGLFFAPRQNIHKADWEENKHPRADNGQFG